MESAYLSNLLRRFEDEHHEALSNILVDGFNAWNVIKFRLFFGIMRDQTGNGKTAIAAPAKSSVQKLLGRGTAAVRCMASLSALLVKARFKSKAVFFYAFASDKPVKDDSGHYFNFLTDPFITEHIVGSYIYAEMSNGGDFKEPGRVKKDIRLDDFDFIKGLHRRRSEKRQDIHVCAAKLFTLMENFFREQQAAMFFDEAGLVMLLSNFYADYKTEKMLLAICRPVLVIGSETPGTGLAAAAKTLNIPLLDLQHGIIDRMHPQYTYGSAMKPAMDTMVLPDFVGVFGELHKNILCYSGFWDEQSVVVLGSSRVEMNRGKYAVKKHYPGPASVLIPTQWTFFTKLQSLLPVLCTDENSQYNIILKLHPHEPANNVEYFKTLAGRFANRMIIAERNQDIYELMAESVLVVGFDSAVLLEALTLSKPCITITTQAAPEGIHGMFNESRLKAGIRPVAMEDTAAITELIAKAIKDKAFYEQWTNDAKRESDFLYAGNYVERCRHFIKPFFSHN